MSTQSFLTLLVLVGFAFLGSVTLLVIRSYLRSTTRPVRNATRVARDWRRILRAQAIEGSVTIRILAVYERKMDGNKAWIEYPGIEGRQDAWFQGQHVFEGDVLVLRGSESGWGPDRKDPNVLFVQPENILAHGLDPANIPHLSSPARQPRVRW